MRDRITDCLGFIADPDAVKTGALMDIRTLWGCFWPVVGIGRFERESAECWSVERRLKFIVVSTRSRRWRARGASVQPRSISRSSAAGQTPPAASTQGTFTATMTSTLSVEISGPIATITFNRPQSLNAITADGIILSWCYIANPLPDAPFLDYNAFANALRNIDKTPAVTVTIWQGDPNPLPSRL